ncbi:3,4-dihydroxy-2-butanone-4-phosphate synthase [Pseudonocardia sp. TRM90224]|uniref:3,4-dihydroxy-2-butanone-4-phosphate synthase n=1 Tax=Pseudonocardia sp. TRM90224 TaxID=2812678 RepID=UPI001E4A2F03|nr:3,4-dihydroxy-2-butanone-4-phosphate synthase [Pseudonocardia sp. TRM90224]
MFTGRISHVGVVERIDRDRIIVRQELGRAVLSTGSSVAINGVRFTIAESDAVRFSAGLSDETRRRSTFDEDFTGRAVHLELPLCVGDRLDGHLVQGYVDGVGKVLRIDAEIDGGHRVWIRPPQRILDELIAKSPICVDGVSLTIAEVHRDRFSVVVLPVTAGATNLGDLEVGRRVNIERDVVGRMGYDSAARRNVNRVLTNLPWSGEVTGAAGVDKVLARLVAGGAVVVWDPDTEGEGDVIYAGATFKPESMTFLLTQVCGFPAVPCATEVLERLDIPAIPGDGDRHGTAFCSPVDYAGNSGTGVSAHERAATVRRLALPDSRPTDFLRPGHVSPIAARPGLLSERSGHTEATVALCTAAGLPPVGVCCEIMNPDGTMADVAEVESFSLRHGLPMISIGDLKAAL